MTQPLLEECEIEIERLRAWLNYIQYVATIGRSNESLDNYSDITMLVDKALSPANAVVEFPRRKQGDPFAQLGVWPSKE